MKSKWYAYAGFVLVCLMGLPYLMLGTESIVTFHDQLDGEVISYLLRAKHLFSGMHEMIPEFFNGVPKAALIPPAPIGVLFFLSGNYFAALILMQMLGSIFGYVGMYLLTREWTENRLICSITGVMFAYLPFIPVHGLSHFGIPLLFLSFLELKEGRYLKISFAYIVFFAFNSSLVLVGFALLAAGFAMILWTWKKGGNTKLLIWGLLLLFMTYLITNLTLFSQFFVGSQNFISHKSDYTLQAENFLRILLDGFLKGRDHSLGHQKYIFWAGLLMLISGWIFTAKKENGELGESRRSEKRRLLKTMAVILVVNFALAFIAALYNAAPGVWLRERFDLLGTIQLTRVLWLAPTLWYLLFALIWIFALLPESEQTLKAKYMNRINKIVSLTLASGMTLLTAFTVLMAGNFKPNVQKLLNPEYPAMSYADFYALPMMGEIERFIWEQTGLLKEEYRVVSLGINPAAALYNGFYCLDGYSTNYPLEYKYAFRKIIAGELEKNESNKLYYDYWGNRVYLFSAENNSMVRKGDFVYQNLTLDTDALKEMGGDFLFSAAYIANAKEAGLKLFREEAFEVIDSYYRVYLYEIQ